MMYLMLYMTQHNALKTNTTVTMSRDDEMCPPEVTFTQGQGSVHSCPVANLFKAMFFSYCLDHTLNYVQNEKDSKER